MGAEAQQMLRLRASVQYNLHGMHACSQHVENPGETWRAIILRHLDVSCKHRMEGSHVQTLYEHAQAYDESEHLPSFKCDAYVSPRSQQARENELKKKTVQPRSMRGLASHALEKHGNCHLLAWCCWCSSKLC